MTDDLLLERAQRLWTTLAGTPVAFRDAAVEVVVSPQSLLCPPGWVGLVALGNAVIATAPDDEVFAIVRQHLCDLPATTVTDPATVRAALPVDAVLGPATLAYCDAASFRPADFHVVEMIPADHADVRALSAQVPPDDAGESGLAEITSPLFALRTGTDITAAAGYQAWPGDSAHISVLTAPAERCRGLARAVASAAVNHALHAGLLPQWRARPGASRRVARALGFHELGSQLSVRLMPVDDAPGADGHAPSR